MNKLKLILGLTVLGVGGFVLWKLTKTDPETKRELDELGDPPPESNKPQFYAYKLKEAEIERNDCIRNRSDAQDCINAYIIAKARYTQLLTTVGYKLVRGNLVKLTGTQTSGTSHGGNDASNGVPNGCVRFWENENYKGAYKDYCDSTSWVGDAHNDSWSSVQVGAGMKAVMCADRNFRGGQKEIKEDTPSLAEWDNKMSSVMIGDVDDILDSAVIGNWGDGNLDGTVDNSDNDYTSGGIVSDVDTVQDELRRNLAIGFRDEINNLSCVKCYTTHRQTRNCYPPVKYGTVNDAEDDYCYNAHKAKIETLMLKIEVNGWLYDRYTKDVYKAYDVIH